MTPLSIFVSWREEAVDRLRAATAKERVLQDWLEGYDLPPLDSYTEGNAWLLEAAREVPQFASDLVLPAAALLREYTDRTLKSQNLERLALNLFFLCAGLRNPPILWQMLVDFLESRALKSGGEPEDLGRYRGVSVVMALRAALAGNQGDHRLEGVWRLMLREPIGYVSDILPEHYESLLRFVKGAPMDGFEGILGLPGEPNEALIGWALVQMAQELDDALFREKQFAGLLERVASRFNTAECTWSVLARIKWPGWAKETLAQKGWFVPPPITVTYVGNEVVVQPNLVKVPAAWRTYGPQFEREVQVIALDSQRSRLRSSLTVRNIRESANHCERKKRARSG